MKSEMNSLASLVTRRSIEFHWKCEKKNALGKQTTRSDIYALSKSSTLNFLSPGSHFIQSNFPLLTISWKLLFLNVLGNVTQIPLLCSARHIVNKIWKMSSWWKPTNNYNTLLEWKTLRMIIMIMTPPSLLGTDSPKTFFQLEDFVLCV